MINGRLNRAGWRAPTILVCTILSLLSTVVAAQAETPSSEEQSCHQFVQSFYDWYVKLARQEHKESSDDIAVRQKSANFSAELKRRLKEDADAAAKSTDGIVGLDFDPFLNAQDFGEKYTVGKVTKKGANYFAEVNVTWNGKKNAKPDVTPELSNKGGTWVFENFHYEKTNIPENENLLGVLAALKKDREKPAHK